MEYKDYYKILGISRGASEQEIKQAYRKLAREYHPDVNPNNKQAEARFKDINEAYQVLSDKEKRSKYDQFGQHYQHYQQSGASPGGFDWGPFVQGGRATPGSGEGSFSDFFEALFGSMGPGGVRFNTSTGYGGGGYGAGYGGYGGGIRVDGQDVEQAVDIMLEEAFTGTQRKVKINAPDGTPRTINVKIPAGVDTGNRVKVSGEGAPGVSGGKRGDLLLLINVKPHDRFERDGDSLKTRVDVDLYTLLLGGDVRIPTIDGKTLTLNIPPGTPNGKVFRLNGQGMPNMHQKDQRGVLYVTVQALLPTALSRRERELFEELRHLRG